MNTLKFKTNINCSGCAAKVAPVLDKAFGTGNWDVDLGVPEKVLTVSAEGVTAGDVAGALKKTGFTAEEL